MDQVYLGLIVSKPQRLCLDRGNSTGDDGAILALDEVTVCLSSQCEFSWSGGAPPADEYGGSDSSPSAPLPPGAHSTTLSKALSFRGSPSIPLRIDSATEES